MEINMENEFYFEECERFFNSIKEEIELAKASDTNENEDSPYWVSQR